MINNKTVDDLQKKYSRTTSGPWINGSETVFSDADENWALFIKCDQQKDHEANAAFIVSAYNSMPELLELAHEGIQCRAYLQELIERAKIDIYRVYQSAEDAWDYTHLYDDFESAVKRLVRYGVSKEEILEHIEDSRTNASTIDSLYEDDDDTDEEAMVEYFFQQKEAGMSLR